MDTAQSYGECMIVAVVNFALPTPLTSDEARALFEASAPNYQNVPGLLRKHFLLADDGRSAGGVYLWESREQADALYDNSWRERVAARYGSQPQVMFYDSQVTVDPSSIIVG